MSGRAAIVGHGSSMQESGLGGEIDGFERIVRVKQGWQLTRTNSKDFGIRLDIHCSTLKTWRPYWKIPIREYWGYQNFPGQDVALSKIREHFGSIKVETADATIKHWLGIYRGFADIRGGGERASDGMVKEGDEPWFSTGMAAIVMAGQILRPAEIVLFGFDHLATGKREDFKNIFRPKDHVYPRHAWNVENRMLSLIEAHYGVRIESRPIERSAAPGDRDETLRAASA